MSNQTYRVSNYDTKITCTSCGSDNVVYYGQLWLDGHPIPKHKCNACNVIFEKYEGGIQNMVSDYQSAASSSNQVSFTPGFGAIAGSGTISGLSGSAGTTISGTISSTSINWQSNGWGNYQQSNDVQDLKNKLQNMEYQMNSLMSLLEDMKNKYDKLMSDPLMHLKVSVRDFDLK